MDWLCGPDTFFYQANARCHFSFYTLSTEAKSCQFLFLPSVFASGRRAKNKLGNKTEKRRGTKYYPLTGSSCVWFQIPEGTIIFPQRANPTQSHAQFLGKDKLWYSPREGWRPKEAHWSTAPEGRSCGELITVSLCGHCWANIEVAPKQPLVFIFLFSN